MSQLMIFAAGFGKRLLPLTLQTPKPLICIDNIPILQHTLNNYQPYCKEPFVINTHYLAKQFQDFVQKNLQYNICLSFEKKILGTAAGLFFAKKYLQAENFWIHNADILCNYNPQKMMDFHQSNKAIVTLGIRSNPVTSSRVQIAPSGEVLGFEKFQNSTSSYCNLKTFCGIHCVSNSIFSLFTSQEIPIDIIDLYQKLLKKGKKILAWELDNEQWIDIGTPQKLAFARKNKESFLK